MFAKNIMKKIRYFIEAVFVRLGLYFFGALEANKSSDVAAKIAKFIGKKIPVNNLAYNNLNKAIPELSKAEKEKILDEMWDNLGRIIGEYPHIAACDVADIERFVELSDETKRNLEFYKNSGQGGIIFSGHIGNWEVGPKTFLRHGIEVGTVYRPLNNPYVEKMTASIRGTEMIEKNSKGNRKIVEFIKNKKFVIILADQKISEGEPIKFFHDYAITATSIARIVLKYNCPLIPARSIRIGNKFKFIVEVEKPLDFQRSNDINADILSVTTKINQKLEQWIRQYPSQWFWVHNRWKK